VLFSYTNLDVIVLIIFVDLNLIITTPEPPIPPNIFPLVKEPPPPPPVFGNPAVAIPLFQVILGTPPPP